MEKKNIGVVRLPPGFRFHPTDEELVVQYLKRKAIDKLPLIPSFFEFVGILFSSWFLYRYLLFKPDRSSALVFWVFGYGSLVWNPGFKYDEKVIGYIKDYRRVFDLACIDHRGTPEAPARTCTLEYSEGFICWGAAYRVTGGPEVESAAMKYLERRECEYDHKISVDFYKEGEELEPLITGVIVFMSTPDKVSNKYYLGPAPLDEMDRQIATAFGPCGNNREYLFLLEKAMRDIGHEDDYVIELAKEVRKVLGTAKGIPKERKLVAPLHVAIKDNIPSLQVRPRQEAVAIYS